MHLIAAADDWIQRRYTKLVHALMRETGVTKRRLRKTLWHTRAASLMCIGALSAATIGWLGILFALVSTFDLFSAWVDDRADEKQEQAPNLVSAADYRESTLKMFGWPFFVSDLAALWIRHAPDRAIWPLVWLLMLALGYLCGVPPEAPQTRKEPASSLARVPA